MLEDLTEESFQPHRGSLFHVPLEGGPGLDLELAEVAPYPRDTTAVPRRAPFSLLFRGPGQAYLPQRTYRLQHPQLGDLDLFLVPIRRDGDTLMYEAVFN